MKLIGSLSSISSAIRERAETAPAPAPRQSPEVQEERDVIGRMMR